MLQQRRNVYSMPFNQPIGNWNTSEVQDMLGMFELNVANQPIGGWNVDH